MASTESSSVVTVDKDDTPQLPELLDIKCLVDDCKELVFKQLDLVDLLNIADSSKQFHPMACQVFKSKYSNRRVAIDQEVGNRNCITSPSITLKLLRNFGHLISDLRINFALFNVEICQKIENYLMNFCYKSLSFLSLRCNPFMELFDDPMPFTNVYSLEMESCCFLNSNITFNEIFPRLRFIQLDSNRYETRSVINTAIPFLRSVAVLNEELNEKDIFESLKLNTQIEKLLLVNYTPNLIRSLNDLLPKLQCLCLRNLPEKFKYDFFEPIQFDNLRHFAMGTQSTLPSLPFSFNNKLEYLSIVAPIQLNRKWLSVFGCFEILKRLGLFGNSGNISDLLELRNIRHETELMNIRYNGEIASTCLDSFLIHSRALKRITITSYPRDFHHFAHNIHTSSRCRITEFPEAKQVTVDYLVFDRRINYEF